jgi:hypothetical protein
MGLTLIGAGGIMWAVETQPGVWPMDGVLFILQPNMVITAELSCLSVTPVPVSGHLVCLDNKPGPLEAGTLRFRGIEGCSNG